MIYAFPVEEIREAEYAAVQVAPTDALMRRAAFAVAEEAVEMLHPEASHPLGQRPPDTPSTGDPAGIDHLRRRLAELPTKPVAQFSKPKIFALAGGGDNGGDALYAAGYLAEAGLQVTALKCARKTHERALEYAKNAGVSIIELPSGKKSLSRLVTNHVASAAVILDGLVGSGTKGELREPAAQVVRAVMRTVNAVRGDVQDGPRIVAIDNPSGVWAQDGSVSGEHLRANATVTMGAVKPAALLAPAAHEHGRVRLLNLGLDLHRDNAQVLRLEPADVARAWPAPGVTDHKYTRGVALVLAASNTYPTTGVMSVSGAVRAGAGMVRFSGPEDAALAVLLARPEVVTAPGRYQALLVGSGIDAADEKRAGEVLAAVSEARAAGLPIVLDAGALDLVPRMGALGAETVITPHAGEAARLLTNLGYGAKRGGLSRAEVGAQPLKYALELAERLGVNVVLKGAVTTVCSASGTVFTDAQAPHVAGTAGSGDILAGIIVAGLAGLRARAEHDGRNLGDYEVAFTAAAGVWIHGTAAALAQQRYLPDTDASVCRRYLPGTGGALNVWAPIVASDIAAEIPAAIAVAR